MTFSVLKNTVARRFLRFEDGDGEMYKKVRVHTSRGDVEMSVRSGGHEDKVKFEEVLDLRPLDQLTEEKEKGEKNLKK